MQLASSGAKAFAGRQVSHFIPNNPGSGRSIHIPSFVPRSTAVKPSGSTVQTLFKQTRTFLTRFVGHLTTPGHFANVPPVGRSLYTAPHHARTIQNGFSFPVKYALGRPLQSPHLPRAPAVPRSVAQVGLGIARNFSTGRPIFQSLADNVPVTGRAFWEADWELNVQEEKAKSKPKKYGGKKENKKARKEMMKPSQADVQAVTSSEETQKAELDHYFPLPVEPEVVTYLLIPLAPTPTSRVPLSLNPPVRSSAHPLLPFSVVASVHQDHALHSLRVSTLFARLDTAHVFDEIGVSCTTFGDPSGLCTVLEVKFSGWTESRVRSILGEVGTGWCVLEEVRKKEEQFDQDAMEEVLSSMTSTGFTTPAHVEIDPAASFVLPTLDFSASFQRNQWNSPSPPPVSTPLSDLEFHNAWSSSLSDSGSDDLSDAFSDMESVAWSDHLPIPRLSRTSSEGSDGWIGLGFSSQFAGRLEGNRDIREGEHEMPEPREVMF